MDDDGDGDVDDGDGVDVDDGDVVDVNDGDVVELTQSCFELRAAHTLGLTSPLGSQTAPAGNFRTRLRAPGKPTPEFQNVSHRANLKTTLFFKTTLFRDTSSPRIYAGPSGTIGGMNILFFL